MTDLISRQDAIDALNRTGDEILPGGILRGTVYRILENLPSAQPERKKGKWYEDEEVGLCKCDQCHGVNLIHTPFCPMCGAKMER